MNARGIILTVIALVLSGLTIVMARSWLESNQQQAGTSISAPVTGPQILVARSNLAIGHIISADDLDQVTWPNDDYNANYIVASQTASAELVGSVVRHGVIAGEPITRARLVARGDRGFLAAVLAPGMRAVTIAVDRTAGISGFIFPGDRVDVILTHEIGGTLEQSRKVSETVLRNSRVLAVDMRTNDQDSTPEIAKAVTIEVSPATAERIAVARRMGEISLSLRGLLRPDGMAATALNRDDSRPNAVTNTHTWDSDISTILPPADGENAGARLTIARGAIAQDVEINGGGT